MIEILELSSWSTNRIVPGRFTYQIFYGFLEQGLPALQALLLNHRGENFTVNFFQRVDEQIQQRCFDSAVYRCHYALHNLIMKNGKALTTTGVCFQGKFCYQFRVPLSSFQNIKVSHTLAFSDLLPYNHKK